MNHISYCLSVRFVLAFLFSFQTVSATNNPLLAESFISEDDYEGDLMESDSIDPMLVSADTVILNLELLDSVVPNYNVFFTGENHRYSHINDDIKFNFITYLNEKVGLNYVAIEFGKTTGWLINRYVVENDTTIEDFFYKMPNQSYERLFKRLRAYNKDKAEKDKIHVLGVDAQKIKEQIFYAVDTYIKGRDIKTAHDSIQLHLEMVHYKAGKITNYRNRMWERERHHKNSNEHSHYFEGDYGENITTLAIWKNNYWKFKKEYDQFFGQDAKQVEHFMNDIDEYINYTRFSFKSKTYLDVYRERLMIQGMGELLKQDPKAKVFAQFGKCHVAELYSNGFCERKNFTPFADRVKENEAFKTLVIGIAYSYEREKEYYDSTYAEMYKEAPLDSLMLFEYPKKDTAMSQPDFLLLAPQFLTRENKDGELEEEDSDNSWKNYTTNTNINYVLGVKFLDANSLDFAFNAGENISFETTAAYQGFEINHFENGSGYGGLRFGGFGNQTITVADTLDAKLTAGMLGLRGGHEFTNSSVFNFATYLGLDVQSYKITIDDKNPNNFLARGGSGFEKIELRNLAIGFDFGMEVNLRLKFINLGVRGGYLWDVSGKGWKDAPEVYETDLGGLYLETVVGICFHSN